MAIRDSMNKWLHKHGSEIDVGEAHTLCSKLGITGDKLDGCYMLVADLEQGRTTDEEFAAGLSVLTGKEPEEVMGILKATEHIKRVIEPFNIHMDVIWERDLKDVENMIRKLDADTLGKLYGMTVEIAGTEYFRHPTTGEPVLGDTRYDQRGKPYLIILGTNTTPRILYHEIAHAIGIDDEDKAMEFARQKEGVMGVLKCVELDLHIGSVCPKCGIGKGLREAGGMEFMLTMDNPFLHCDTCGATYVRSHDGSWQYIETVME